MSQVGRISGPLLKDNLLRNGVDLSFSNTLGTDYVLYLDVSTSTLGITKDVPATDLDNIGNTLRSTNFINNTVYPVPIANFNIDDSDLNVLVGDINLNAGEAIVLSNFENDNIKISDNTISTYRSNASIELNPNGTGIVNIINGLNVYGHLDTPYQLTLGGSITLGDSLAQDTIDFKSEVTSNFNPDVSHTSNVGSLSKQWATSHSETLNSRRLNSSNVEIFDNVIRATISNDNLDLQTQGTGNVGLENVHFNQDVVSTKSDSGNLDLELAGPTPAPAEYNWGDDGDASFYSWNKISGTNYLLSNLLFNNTGTQLYYPNNASIPDSIYVHTLSTPWDVTSNNYPTTTYIFDVTGECPSTNNMGGIWFKPDGSKLFCCGGVYTGTETKLWAYDLSTPFDLSTATFNSEESNALATPSDVDGRTGIFIDPTGKYLYFESMKNSIQYIHRRELATAWDISTIPQEDHYTNTSTNKVFAPGIQSDGSWDDQMRGNIWITPDGGKWYGGFWDWEHSGSANVIYEFGVSTPWDFSTSTATGQSINIRTQQGVTPAVGDDYMRNEQEQSGGLFFKPDYTRMYVRTVDSASETTKDSSGIQEWTLDGLSFSGTDNQITIDTTTAIKIATGDQAQRPNINTGIRFNTTAELFEGYNSGNTVFGGVYSDDAETNIIAHPTNDTLLFTANSIASGFVDSGGPNLTGLQVDDILFDVATVSTVAGNTNLNLVPNGTGEIVINDISFSDTTIKNNSNNAFNISHTNAGFAKFVGTHGLVIPVGTTAERPTSPDTGDTRWNTTVQELETFDGTNWIAAAGAGSVISEAAYNELLLSYIISMG